MQRAFFVDLPVTVAYKTQSRALDLALHVNYGYMSHHN
jgi:hypothetical protein